MYSSSSKRSIASLLSKQSNSSPSALASLCPSVRGHRAKRTAAADELYRANDLAQKYFHHLLLNDDAGASARTYLQTRGLTGETIARFGLGYAPPEWDALLKVAGRRGLSPQILERAGLALPRSTGSGHYDRFRDRIAFPIANLSDRTIAFGARALQPDQEPKYLNSPETSIYHKGRVLYGLSDTRDAIRRQDAVLVVEGYMDLISLVQAGIQHVVATSGTALTEDHGRLLARFARQVVLLFDGDAAGSTAAMRGLEVILGTGLDARVVSLPAEHDPDSFVQEHGPRRCSNEPKTPSRFSISISNNSPNSTTSLASKAKRMLSKDFKPLLAKPRDAVRRDLLLREVAGRLSVDEQALRHDLQASMRRADGQTTSFTFTARQAEGQTTAPPDPPRHELEFVGLLLNFPQLIPETVQRIRPRFADRRPHSGPVSHALRPPCPRQSHRPWHDYQRARG